MADCSSSTSALQIVAQAAKHHDQLAMIEASTKAKAGGLLQESQLPWVYEELGWKQPDWDLERARQAEADAAAQERAPMFKP